MNAAEAEAWLIRRDALNAKRTSGDASDKRIKARKAAQDVKVFYLHSRLFPSSLLYYLHQNSPIPISIPLSPVFHSLFSLGLAWAEEITLTRIEDGPKSCTRLF